MNLFVSGHLILLLSRRYNFLKVSRRAGNAIRAGRVAHNVTDCALRQEHTAAKPTTHILPDFQTAGPGGLI